MILLLIALMLEPSSNLKILDTHFALVQEEWIYAHARPFSLDQVLPRDLADLIRDLGCGRFTRRQNAERLLSLESSERVARALVWGSHAKDAEIANRCDLLLRAYRTCDHCQGTAWCPTARPRWEHPCDVCEDAEDARIDDVLYRMRCDAECLRCYATGYLDGRMFRSN